MVVEWNCFVKLLEERNFDALALSWTGQVHVDPKQIFHTASDSQGGSNFVGYRNTEVDKLIDEARETVDKGKRIKLLQTVYEKIAEDAPYLFLFNPRFAFYAHTPKVKKPRDTLRFGIGVSYWWGESK